VSELDGFCYRGALEADEDAVGLGVNHLQRVRMCYQSARAMQQQQDVPDFWRSSAHQTLGQRQAGTGRVAYGNRILKYALLFPNQQSKEHV
jgi:hypothetical protein